MPMLWEVGYADKNNQAKWNDSRKITNMRMNKEKQFLQIPLRERYLWVILLIS